MFEGVLGDFMLANLGGAVMTVGILGLALGGNLPLIRIPDRLKPAAKLAFTVALVIGLTLLLDRGHPDLLEQLLRELA